jgi:short-subunit dehydrogenase
VAEQKRPVTVITGASSGIGRALAHEFASHGHELVLVARREQALTAIAEAIAASGMKHPTVLRLDLGRIDAARDLADALAQRALEPEILVNNAGFALLGAADRLDRAEQLAMLDLNVRALTDMCLTFVDSIERRQGGILNVASIAGFMPGPYMAVYYASKAYVLSFTEALHEELRARGIRVTALCPGPVPTEFQARAGMALSSLMKFMTVSPEFVARDAYRGFQKGQRLVVPGIANKALPLLLRITHPSVALRLVRAQHKPAA